MNKFRKTVVLIVVLEILLVMVSNVFFWRFNDNADGMGKVEAKRVARRIEAESVENIDVGQYDSIIKIEKMSPGDEVNNDYIVAFHGDEVYRIE